MPPKATTKTPTATAVTATAKKKIAGPNTSGKTNADYSATTPAVRVISKVYGLATHNKYAISYFAKGSTHFAEIEFFVNSVIPEVGGYLATLSDDGFTKKWSRPIEERLFTMGHFKSIMGEDYSPSHVQVRAFDDVTQKCTRTRLSPTQMDSTGVTPRRSISRASALALPSCRQRSTKRPPPSMSSGTGKAVRTTSFTLLCPARFR